MKKLVPVFLPPLATILAAAETQKGSRLTETEVVAIRDEASCIMMEDGDAAKMAESRGFHDVVPENCWADWHRLRVQETGVGYLPKLMMCMLGDDDFEKVASRLLKKEGIEHESRGRDDRMMTAFQASMCRYDGTSTEKDRANIHKHTKVLYVVSPNFKAQDGPGICRDFLTVGARLLELGGLAMKCESSGISNGRSRWIELAEQARGEDSWAALLRAYVQMPIENDGDYYTCGLHLLGMPDLIVSRDVLKQGYGSDVDIGWTSIHLFFVFAHYLLAECMPGQFVSGHTFSTDAKSPRFRVQWEDCTGYDEDDFFHNPFGRWRFKVLVG